MLRPSLRPLAAFAHDVLASAAAWALAFWLRFNFDIPADYAERMLRTMPAVMALSAAIFWRVGLYRGLWRYASLPDMQRILAAVTVAALAAPALFTLIGMSPPVPRTVYVISPLVLAGSMCLSRLLYRAWKERALIGVVRHPDATPVLVLGAGDAASDLIKSLARSAQWRVAGLLDDDAAKQRRQIQNVSVLGPLATLAEHASRLGVQHAVIAMPASGHGARWRAHSICAAAGVQALTVPSYDDIVAGKVTVSQLRTVELDDLLGRDAVTLDEAGLAGFLGGKRVLVTGAGGSIGAELCRQVARFAPERLVLLEISEYALYSIEQEFRDRLPAVAVAAVIGDAKSGARMNEIFQRYRPQVVFHAAAYKHVPLMEEANAFEAVANNVLSTVVVARAAQAAGAAKFVLVSTDKAVNPTNVMGASKRLAELACSALQRELQTQFVIVRFGNVLGSTGSVIPRFRGQIARGGPVTVTHPEIERYFMSIPEAAQLVLQAALMGNSGEIFVLDMGQPVKIADLARQLIRLSGFAESDIRIVYTGLRAGEKLYEEPLADAERSLATPHPKLRIARASGPADEHLLEQVLDWLAAPGDASPAAVRTRLQSWIPEYSPPGNGASAQLRP